MLTELGFRKTAKKQNEAPLGPVVIAGGAGLAAKQGILYGLQEGPLTDAHGKMPKHVAKSVNAYIKKHGLENVPLHLGYDAQSPGMFIPKYLERFSPFEHGVHVSNAKVEAVLLHELGHAKDFRRLGKLKHVGQSVGMLGSLASPGIAALAANKTDNPYLAAAAPVVAAAPLLRNEGKATGSALKHLVKTHGWKKGLSKGKILGPAFATYGIIPAASAVGAYVSVNRKNKS